MRKPLAMPQKRTGVRIRTLGLLILFSAQAGAQAPRQASGSQQSTYNASEEPTEPLAEKAWRILHNGLKETNADKRAKALRALGLLAGSAEAQKAAILALKDEKPPVRLAAAVALGSMRAEQVTGSLEEALGDSEPSVVLAAANSLLLLHDDVGYDTYYEVLTGERRASKGLVQNAAMAGNRWRRRCVVQANRFSSLRVCECRPRQCSRPTSSPKLEKQTRRG